MPEKFADTVVVAISFDRGNKEEAARIVRTAAAAVSIGFDYLVVDSGSMPETIEVLERLGAKVIKQTEKGVGNAIVQAMREGAKTGKKFVIYTEGDKEHFPSQLPKLVEKLRQGYDFVVPTRMHASMKRFAFIRRWEERAFNALQSAIVRHWADFSYGPKAFRTETIEPLLRDMPASKGWEIAGFLPAKAAFLGLRIGSVKVYAPPMEHEVRERLSKAIRFRVKGQFAQVLRGLKLAAKTSGYRGIGFRRKPI